jgi:formylglycine-generating enzyme required for sulfatase activity
MHMLLLCWGQKTGRTSGRTQKTSTSSKAVQNGRPVTPKQVNVLFATNEDCDLFINGDNKGPVSKTNFLYLKLPEGNYQYIAVDKNTKFEFADSFRVRAGGTNEVFIDLLYLVDSRNEKSSLASGNGSGIVHPLQKNIGSLENPGGDFQRLLTGVEASVINALLAGMVEIRGGNFTMGNGRSKSADEAEHPVTISPFFMGKFEVTQFQWETIMGYNPSAHKGNETRPVENVSWEEVMRFIRKLNVISGRRFRLPTEAEWEYVYRLGGKAEIDQAGGQEAFIRKTAWFFSNAEKSTHPVGTLQPNSAGIFDLTGNVSEWCVDWYAPYYYKEDFSQLNPEGPPLGKEKVVRGGNYKDFVGDRFRPSFRNRRSPVEKGSEIGFRLAMDAQNN